MRVPRDAHSDSDTNRPDTLPHTLTCHNGSSCAVHGITGQPEGHLATRLDFSTDTVRGFSLGVEWTIAGELYVLPGPNLVLKQIASQADTFAAVTVGVRVGELDPPVAILDLEDAPGATVEVEEEVDVKIEGEDETSRVVVKTHE